MKIIFLAVLTALNMLAVPVGTCENDVSIGWSWGAQAESFMRCMNKYGALELGAASYTIEKPIVMKSNWTLTGVSPVMTSITNSSTFYSGNNQKSMILLDSASNVTLRDFQLAVNLGDNMVGSGDLEGIIQFQSTTGPTNNNVIDNVSMNPAGNAIPPSVNYPATLNNAVIMVTKDNLAAHSMKFNKICTMTISGFRNAFTLYSWNPAAWPTPAPNPVSDNLFINNVTSAVHHVILGGGAERNEFAGHFCHGGITGNDAQTCIMLDNPGGFGEHVSYNTIRAHTDATGQSLGGVSPLTTSQTAHKNTVIMDNNDGFAFVLGFDNNLEMLGSYPYIDKYVSSSKLTKSFNGGHLLGAVTAAANNSAVQMNYTCTVAGATNKAVEVFSEWSAPWARVINIDNTGNVCPTSGIQVWSISW